MVTVNVLLILLLNLSKLIHFRNSSEHGGLLTALNFAQLFIAALHCSVAVFRFFLLVFEARGSTDSSVSVVLVIDEHHLALHVVRSICASLLLHTGIAGVGREEAVRLLTHFDVFVLYTEAPEGTHRKVRIRTLNREIKLDWSFRAINCN